MTSGYRIYFSESGARKKRSIRTGISLSEKMLYWVPDVEVIIIPDSTESSVNLNDADVTPLGLSFFPNFSASVSERTSNKGKQKKRVC